MQIKTLRPFWDLDNPAEEPVASGSELTVSDERALHLVGLGFAEPAPGQAMPLPTAQPSAPAPIVSDPPAA